MSDSLRLSSSERYGLSVGGGGGSAAATGAASAFRTRFRFREPKVTWFT